MEQATVAKSAVEDAQRDLRKKREESGEVHTPQFFEIVDGRWLPKLKSVPVPLRYLISLLIFKPVFPWNQKKPQRQCKNGYFRLNIENFFFIVHNTDLLHDNTRALRFTKLIIRFIVLCSIEFSIEGMDLQM